MYKPVGIIRAPLMGDRSIILSLRADDVTENEGPQAVFEAAIAVLGVVRYK